MANVQRTVETVVFPYSRKKDGEKFEDGVAWKVPGGVVVEMWGGENVYHLTSVWSQAGTFAVRLTSTLVDSLSIPTDEWRVHVNDPRNIEGQLDQFKQVVRKAAGEICKHCGEGDAEVLAKILLQMEAPF